MSGNVVAWVYEHYPVRDARARTRKIILSEIAEAANRDFEHAHPGVAKLCAHWHFSRSTVNTAIAELVGDGWLEITEQGGGRGHATEYRIRRERATETVRESDGSAAGNRAICDPKPRDSGAGTARFPGPSRITHPRDTPVENTRAEPMELGVEVLAGTDPVQTVFDAWLVSTGGSGRTQLDAPRRKAIESALALGYPVEDLVDAVRGWRHSPHHRGENERRTVYNRLPLLLRDRDQIERFRDLERGDARVRPKASRPKGQDVLDMIAGKARGWQEEGR